MACNFLPWQPTMIPLLICNTVSKGLLFVKTTVGAFHIFTDNLIYFQEKRSG
jgi:hypothetical protein